MLTNGVAATTAAATGLRGPSSVSTTTAAQKVVIVNGTTETLELFDTVLEARHYDVVFVESNERAYSQIKRVQPNLVILCVRIEDTDAFQVLSMLKLDQETREIPVLTYTTEYEGQNAEAEMPEPSDKKTVAPKPALRMN